MPRQLFGTDGIRGVAGHFPLDAKTVYAVGIALGELAARLQSRPEIVLGMDTRESGPWIGQLVAGGLAGKGVNVRSAGLITTPGIAYLTRTNSFVAGVMISASHNPYQDNGIKVFGHSGYKLPDNQEHELEQEIFRVLDSDAEPVPGAPADDPELDRAYLDYLASTFPFSLDGIKVVVDCAHGSASRLAPELFGRLGANVYAVGCSPNGRNINLGCGALHVEMLRETVLSRQADLGLALDGDADRSILISSSGRILDGDAILLMAARFLLARGKLPGPEGKPAVVATVMSNLGLEKALAKHGIQLLRTPVGDKYVLEEMLRCSAMLGGEQSGHVIFRHYATTGDGLLTTLRILEMMQSSDSGLDELAQGLEVYPQRLVNVRVRTKKPLDELPQVAAEIRAAQEAFGDSGRVVVRFSGTEPLARVMIEGPDAQKVDEFVKRIAEAIQLSLGAETS
jgi:phosphoglucosamine mutase